MQQEAFIPEHIIACPSCSAPTRYAKDNPYRPFCSARCRGVDFGAWAGENFRIASTDETAQEGIDVASDEASP